ncbi:flagellar brake domain-containing protein [Pseudodesulfovibrio cashew]|uniref:flagellar brake domain-containing protein n=1 Tax=Pseudodesulfovibrio cashew TaxID=2678688 RepID=UPI00131B0F52|nr:PilZ domain-containing protein [Pseudodesulfovibrio cashew]
MSGIQAGDKILLEFSTFGDRFLSVVTDVVQDGRLLVYSPVTAPIIERLETDRKVVVKYAEGGKLLGFRSRVLNRLNPGNSLFELAPPERTFDAEERAEPRCSCGFPAMIREGAFEFQAVVEDMSHSCSRIRFLNGGSAFAEGMEGDVSLTFHPFDMDKGYSVECIVKNIFLKGDVRYAILEFKKDEAEARNRISRFIEAKVCCGIPRV